MSAATIIGLVLLVAGGTSAAVIGHALDKMARAGRDIVDELAAAELDKDTDQ